MIVTKERTEEITDILGTRTIHISESHTQECWDLATKVDKSRLEFFAKYPNACLSCNAVGGRSYPSTWEEPGGFDDCEDCVYFGMCPLCGKEQSEEYFDRCEHCEWKYDRRDLFAPAAYECWGCIDYEEAY